MSEDLATVVTVSDRSAAGERQDGSGPVAVARLEAAGFRTNLRIVPDGAESVAAALREAVAAGTRVIITSGGTGIGPRDLTPEGTRLVITREVEGIAELLRLRAIEVAPHAALGRGTAGVVGQTLIINLPGSPKAVDEGLDVVLPLLPHALSQLSGGDH